MLRTGEGHAKELYDLIMLLIIISFHLQSLLSSNTSKFPLFYAMHPSRQKVIPENIETELQIFNDVLHILLTSNIAFKAAVELFDATVSEGQLSHPVNASSNSSSHTQTWTL